MWRKEKLQFTLATSVKRKVLRKVGVVSVISISV